MRGLKIMLSKVLLNNMGNSGDMWKTPCPLLRLGIHVTDMGIVLKILFFFKIKK